MLRESDFGGRKYFVRKFHSPPSPTTINWYVLSGKKLTNTSGVAVDLVNINNNNNL